MLTRRGWGFAIGAVVTGVAGRVFGLQELFVLSTGAVALVAVALAFVRARAVRLDARRELHPPQVHAGTDSRVDLTIRNAGRTRTPVVDLRDPFDRGARWARFKVAPLRPGEARRSAYRLPTEHRGIFDIGPLEVALSDPFGLAGTVARVAGTTQLTVYPRIDRVRPLPHSEGQDPQAGARHATALLGPGEDFYALREYQRGDDTRRVHWPSTARLGELMIRQDEMPWQNRATVLLDVRSAVHTAESLELAVSAAASIHAACDAGGAVVRLLLTNGVDSGPGVGHAHRLAVLEHLATVKASRTDGLAHVVAQLRRGTAGGALAVVTTDLAPAGDLETYQRLGARFGRVLIVRFERSSYDAGPAPLGARPGAGGKAAAVSGRVVAVTADEPFATAWDRAMSMQLARR